MAVKVLQEPVAIWISALDWFSLNDFSRKKNDLKGHVALVIMARAGMASIKLIAAGDQVE